MLEGRTNTLEDPKFKYVDLGGAYVGPTQNRILRVAKELGIETYKVYNEGNTVELLGGKRQVFFWGCFYLESYRNFGLLQHDSYVG